MQFNKIMVAVLMTAGAALAHADALSTDFNTAPATIGALGSVTVTPGDANAWTVPSNAATSGTVADFADRTGGGKGLVVSNNGSGNDGVINNIRSGRLLDAAGESSVASFDTFTASYWFRTASTESNTGFTFKSEVWGQSDRTSWLGFTADENGMISVLASAPAANGSDWVDTAVNLSSTLHWGDWYQVVTTIHYFDGEANDVVNYSIFDSEGALIGTADSSTWEQGQRHAPAADGGPYNGGNLVAADSIGFQVRGAGAGDIAYVDDVTWSSSNARDGNQVPEPASLALVGVALAGLGLARRRKA